jgi:hypothetical protein
MQFGSWDPASASGTQALLPTTGIAQGSCIVDFSDGTSTQTPEPDAGQVAVSVVSVASVTVTCTGFIDQEGDRGCSVGCEGTSGACSGGGNSVQFPCPPAGYGVGPFALTTAEGTGGSYSISPGQNLEISTSSDGTAFVSATAC